MTGRDPQPPRRPPKSRGTGLRPQNRFEPTRLEDDFEHAAPPDPADGDADGDAAASGAAPDAPRAVPTQFLPDASRSILVENDSPDVGFRYSVNPYRGCEHGCSYCYARPSHEYLSYNAGIDFETKILVKHDAPDLLRAALRRPSWKCEPIQISGVTDCYQPAEHRFRLTRGCLEVMLEARQPATIITKNALVLRDLDILAEMARHRLIAVSISVTTLDAALARDMEPRTSTPAARLRAVRGLREAGVPVGVMVAPIIPGLTDRAIPGVLEAAAGAGAQWAGYTVLRLPWAVRPIFLEWLERTRPLAKGRVESHIRAVRGGRLNGTDFGSRMSGDGPAAEQIRQMFRVFAARHGLLGNWPALDGSHFRLPAPPRPKDPPPDKPDAEGQLRLF